ncbi:Extracellular protease precursor [Pseudoalteromonas luteoviolacea B = ATCC 29581]|nr:Extracellular protease precursor [Pseudoalteromonas luteoviolacea B = ATCC 29581]
MTTTQNLSRMTLLAAFLGSASAMAGNSIQVNVDVQPMENGNVSATVHFTNTTNKTQKILGWYTNLEEEHIFHITRDGEEVEFQGPHYKRPAPQDSDYIKLKAGETLSKTFELTSYYDFSQPGNYEVSYSVRSLSLFNHTLVDPRSVVSVAPTKSSTSMLQSSTQSIWFDGMPMVFDKQSTSAKGGKGGGSEDCVGGTCFTGRCDNAQKSDILSALNAADQITNDSVAYLSSHSANTSGTRYNTWFGASTSSRYSTITANFNAINDAIDNKPLTFDCSCKQSYFAYVYPNQPYKVYLCKAFWSANELGTDSRAGTIVHELSHFNAVAGTDDIVYGQAGAKNLAISDPAQAIQNADSHEYFAENTPYQN